MSILLIVTLILFCAGKSLRSSKNIWALTSEEISLSRNSYDRENISDLTEGNNVEVLLDGENFMSALYDDMQKTKAGDFIHGTFFEEEEKVMLRPNASDIQESEKTSLLNTIDRAIQRGVKIRLLVNTNAIQFIKSVPFCLRFNLICGYLCCATDARHYNWIGGNMHTKMWIVKHGDETIVYNGGIDIARGRWDTQRHDNSPERKMNFNFFSHTAVHDTVIRLRGPIVVDYERHFHQTWNDPYPAIFPILWLPKYEWLTPPFIKHENGLQAQLLRTVGCKGGQKGFYKNFAPRGETTAMAAIYKLIAKAENYIYMEDQFFNFDEVLRVIKDALPKLRAVIIVTNSQAFPNLMATERFYFQYKALSQLIEDPVQASKVHIFSLVRDTDPSAYVYVHSKFFLADDEYIISGSFGVERSGLTNDIEVGMGLFDPRGKFASKVRRKIWSEHLMISEDDPVLKDPVECVNEWVRQADSKIGRVRHYFPKNPQKTLLTDLFYQLYEVDGRCH